MYSPDPPITPPFLPDLFPFTAHNLQFIHPEFNSADSGFLISTISIPDSSPLTLNLPHPPQSVSKDSAGEGDISVSKSGPHSGQIYPGTQKVLPQIFLAPHVSLLHVTRSGLWTREGTSALSCLSELDTFLSRLVFRYKYEYSCLYWRWGVVGRDEALATITATEVVI
jgi:hypothetical protein